MRAALALLLCTLAGAGQPIAITHITVIDAGAGLARPRMTVIVRGDRITAAGTRVRAPRGLRVVDGRGKYLIPGLWDMHVHLRANFDLAVPDASGRTFYAPHFVANGITGVRSMWDSAADIRRLREAMAAGEVAGPRIVSSGNMLDGPRPFVPGAIACATPEQGRQAVRRLKAEGSDFIKVYSWLPRDVYFAIVKEAASLGLSVAGHLPNSVTASEASDAGQKSMEHLMGIPLAGDSQALFATFVRNGTWQTPTLTALRSVAYFGDPQLANPQQMADLPPALAQFWKSGGPGMARVQDATTRKREFERQLEFVGAMHRAGVKILAGTDTPNPYVFPGSSLHDELELLVRAGLTPAEALRAATVGAAEYLGLADRLGAVEPGKLADLVLLDANPLDDVANTRRIHAVVLGGKLHPKADLERMLTEARRTVTASAPASRPSPTRGE
jgi:imidazolonepropionase-like amidohydrolase